METTDYVTYELAVKLKACGFDEPCEAFYLPPMKNRPEPFFSGRVKRSIKNETHAFHLSVPSLYHAQKWLREKWGIHVDACIYSDYSTDADGNVCDRWDFWGFDLYAVVGGEKMIDEDGEYDSYEQALSEGIKSALELIKKGE